MKHTMIKILLLVLSPCFAANAQAVLTADGPGNTYERINSVLAPGYDVVENPECVHPAFGRHIAEVFDTDLNQYVFEFYAHVNEDNDRCINFDRQRIEIKTYDQSPDSLIGTTGEFITYKWRFKIPVGFKPSSSFTHIHQVKPVNGDDDQPLFTLTVRKGTPNKLELIHVVSGTSGSTKVSIVNLPAFEGVWVEATEQVLVGLNGTYSMNIKRVSDGASLMSYTNTNINTIRADNSFIRPKWGIYRSLNTPADLRDESIRFSYFSIKEGLEVLPVDIKNFDVRQQQTKVALSWSTGTEDNSKEFIVERSNDGSRYESMAAIPASGLVNGSSYSYDDNSPLAGKNSYRLKITGADGSFKYSDTRTVKFDGKQLLHIYPNPVTNKVTLSLPSTTRSYQLSLSFADGKQLLQAKSTAAQLNAILNNFLPNMKAGIYLLKAQDGATCYNQTFVKQ